MNDEQIKKMEHGRNWLNVVRGHADAGSWRHKRAFLADQGLTRDQVDELLIEELERLEGLVTSLERQIEVLEDDYDDGDESGEWVFPDEHDVSEV